MILLQGGWVSAGGLWISLMWNADRLTVEGKIEPNSFVRIFHDDTGATNCESANGCCCCQCSGSVPSHEGCGSQRPSRLLSTPGAWLLTPSIRFRVLIRFSLWLGKPWLAHIVFSEICALRPGFCGVMMDAALNHRPEAFC